MSKIKPITTEEWIRAAFPVETKKPEGSFSIDEMMKITGYKRSTAIRHLLDKVEEGVLEEKTILINGRNMRIFCPVKNDSRTRK